MSKYRPIFEEIHRTVRHHSDNDIKEQGTSNIAKIMTGAACITASTGEYTESMGKTTGHLEEMNG